MKNKFILPVTFLVVISLVFLALKVLPKTQKADPVVLYKEVDLLDLPALESGGDFTFEESLEKWEELKKEHGNSYVYQTIFSSWTGSGSTTELQIENGDVVLRKYKSYYYDDKQSRITDSYIEMSDELGSHSRGGEIATIDELYNICARSYLEPEINFAPVGRYDDTRKEYYFSTSKDGILTLCGFVPVSCADDCYEGISIDTFEWLDEIESM